MITKQDLLDACLHEIRVSKQLLTHMPEGGWDFRFTPAQRSTLDLARYICVVGQGCVHAGNDQSFEWFGANNERFQALTTEEIPAALDHQIEEMTRLFSEIPEGDLQSKQITVPDMGTWKLGMWLVGTVLKFLTAYKLQLFLQLKAAGASDLNTMDAWQSTGEEAPKS